jgi:transcriptional regulator with XRE-family HTH domain
MTVPEADQDGRARQIGRRIIQARQELGGVTQEELAELVGVSVRSMQAYESGEVIPYRKLRQLAEALGRTPAWLLHGEDAPENHLQAIHGVLVEIRNTNNEILELLRRQQVN